MVDVPMDARLDAQEPRTEIPDNPTKFIAMIEATQAWTTH